MIEVFTKELEGLIGGCYKRARENRQEYMTVEDLLLAVMDDPEVQTALGLPDEGVLAIKTSLIDAIRNSVRTLEPNDDKDTQPTLGFQRVLQRAVYHVQSKGGKDVTPVECLVAIFGEKDSHAVYILNQQNIDRLDIVNFLATGIPSAPKPLNTWQETIETISFLNPFPPKREEPLRIFLSYSHRDTHFLERLLVHLKPLQRIGKIDAWSDKRIRPGDKWKSEIAENVEKASVGVILLTADFLASDFIVTNELPPLLMNADSKGTRIIPVVLKPCGIDRDVVLRNFQCINDPKDPLLGMSEIEQERLYDRIANEVHDELNSRIKSRQTTKT